MATSVGEKIRLLRIKANLSQEELAQKLYFSNSTISNWEKGRREVSMENLHNLASFFGVEVSYLVDQYSQLEWLLTNLIVSFFLVVILHFFLIKTTHF